MEVKSQTEPSHGDPQQMVQKVEFLETEFHSPSAPNLEDISPSIDPLLFTEITSQSILAKNRINTPLLQFLLRLVKPQLVKCPPWFPGLGLDGTNVKIFLPEDAESEILGLFLDLTHRSFLHFCTHLVHDRLVESSHL